MPPAAQHRLVDRRQLRRVRRGLGRVRGTGPGRHRPARRGPTPCAREVTTYKAVKVSGARSSDLVAVFGIGGLGHLAVQYARIAGATVVAVDVTAEKLDQAKRLGAAYTIDASQDDPVSAILALGGADKAIATAASRGPFSAAYRCLRRGGHLVYVGLPAENTVELPIFKTVLNGITITGSIVGTRTPAESGTAHRNRR